MSKGWMGCLVVLGAIVLVLLIAGGWLAGRYNGMVRQNEQINNAWAQVKVVLQRRLDLLNGNVVRLHPQRIDVYLDFAL